MSLSPAFQAGVEIQKVSNSICFLSCSASNQAETRDRQGLVPDGVVLLQGKGPFGLKKSERRLLVRAN
jgi:hypothetical protein